MKLQNNINKKHVARNVSFKIYSKKKKHCKIRIFLSQLFSLKWFLNYKLLILGFNRFYGWMFKTCILFQRIKT